MSLKAIFPAFKHFRRYYKNNEPFDTVLSSKLKVVGMFKQIKIGKYRFDLICFTNDPREIVL